MAGVEGAGRTFSLAGLVEEGRVEDDPVYASLEVCCNRVVPSAYESTTKPFLSYPGNRKQEPSLLGSSKGVL